MIFPLDKEFVYFTNDPDSFKRIDFDRATEIPIEDHVGAFGTKRKYDIHTGVDLYCNDGDSVLSIEEGIVVLIEDFTGGAAGSAWWNNTKAIHIEGKSGVIVYGEIEPSLELTEGSIVKEGQEIGRVKQVLKNNKGRPMSMLHIELYRHGSRQSCIWQEDKPMNTDLLDPTQLLSLVIAKI